MSVFSESVGDGVAEFTHFPLGASVVLPTVHDAPSESFYLEVFGATSFTPVVVSVATVAVWDEELAAICGARFKFALRVPTSGVWRLHRAILHVKGTK